MLVQLKCQTTRYSAPPDTPIFVKYVPLCVKNWFKRTKELRNWLAIRSTAITQGLLPNGLFMSSKKQVRTNYRIFNKRFQGPSVWNPFIWNTTLSKLLISCTSLFLGNEYWFYSSSANLNFVYVYYFVCVSMFELCPWLRLFQVARAPIIFALLYIIVNSSSPELWGEMKYCCCCSCTECSCISIQTSCKTALLPEYFPLHADAEPCSPKPLCD